MLELAVDNPFKVLQMSKASQSKEFLRIKKAIREAAKAESTKPQTISKSQFWLHAPKEVTEWQIRKLGGFVAVRDQCFPAPACKTKDEWPEHPLASEEVSKKVGQGDEGGEVTELIKQSIQECADKLGFDPCNVVWPEYSTHIRRHWGDDNLKVVRCTITRMGGFYAIRNAHFPMRPTQITVNRQRLKQQAAINQKLGYVYAEQAFVLSRVEEFVDRVFTGKVEALPPKLKNEKTSRALNITLSDLHFGSDLKKKNTSVLDYGKKEEARRLAWIVKQVCEYKRQYRASTVLNVLLLGDILQGQLHDLRDGAIYAEQMSRAIHLLDQAIGRFAAEFKKVNIYCVSGNHDRWIFRHKERATYEKHDSAATVIYFSLKKLCRDLKHVTFYISETPTVDYVLPGGHRVFATHGDTVLSTGNVSKSIPIASIENQCNKINASLNDNDEYSIFVCGHIHKGQCINMDNGAVLITNGALIPPDHYAVSLGVFEGRCGQQMWESTPGYPLGDTRFINVGIKQDQDESLEAIIQPWTGFNQ